MNTLTFAPFSRVVVGYAVVSFLWVLLSDRAVDLLFLDHGLHSNVQTWKGWFFVLVTTVLLHVLLRRLYRQMHDASAERVDALKREAQAAMLLQTLADTSPDAIYVKDRDGRFLFFNREAAHLSGLRVEDVLGQGMDVLFPPEQVDVLKANDAAVMRQGKTLTFEETVDTVHGRRIYLATKGPLGDASGAIGSFGISRDITEMVNVRRQLQESEHQYRALFDDNPQPMWVVDLEDLRFLSVNDAAVAQYGYSRAEFLAMHLPVVAPPDLAPDLRPVMHNKLHEPAPAHRRTGPWRHRCQDGRVIEVEIAGSNIEFQGRRARVGLLHDVTDRNRLQRERDAAHQQLQDVLSRVTDAFVSIDNQQRFNYVNQRAASLAGVAAPQDLTGQPVSEGFSQAVGTPFQTAYWRAVETRQPEVVEGWLAPAQRWFELRLFPAADGMSAYITDITDRKQAEQLRLQAQHELSELSQRLMAQERQTSRRIAQSLHDRLGQQLGSARLYLDVALARQAEGSEDGSLGALHKVSDTLDGAIAEVRHVLRDMRPPLLEERGLGAALANELQVSPAGELGLRVELELGAAVQGLRWPDAIEYAAFMIAREAIGNAVRHARARGLKVVLDGDAGHLVLRVEDDGLGIDPAEWHGRPGHLGIVGMRERAAAIGAVLAIQRRPGGGTVVRLALEIDAP